MKITDFLKKGNNLSKRVETIERLINSTGSTQQDVINAFLMPSFNYGISETLKIDKITSYSDGTLITLNYQLLNQLYKTIGIVQRICQLPVDIVLNQKINIKTKQATSEEVEVVLQNLYDTRFANGFTLIQIIKYAHYMSSLFGGSVIIIEDGNNLTSELDYSKIIGYNYYDIWQISRSSYGENIHFHGQKVHESRVIKIKGQQSTSLYNHIVKNWGLSILEDIRQPLCQYLMAVDNITELTSEAKLDILKVSGMTGRLQTSDQTALRKFYQYVQNLVNTKNARSMLLLDKEDQEFEQKTINFTIAKDIAEIAKDNISASKGFSKGLLFGEQAGGFASGQDALERDAMKFATYQDMIKPTLMKAIDLQFQALYGYKLTDCVIEFENVRHLTPEQDTANKSAMIQNIMNAVTNGFMTHEQAIAEINAQGIFQNRLDEVIF